VRLHHVEEQAMSNKTFKRKYLIHLLVAAAVLVGSPCVLAQSESSPIKVPADGQVNFKDMTLMGEEIRGALSSHVDRSPMSPYIGNTLTCSVPGLWECHTWFEANGTGVLFHAYKKVDGSLELGSTAFTYRMTGKPGDYHLCLKLSGSSNEQCAKQKWDETHFLYDEWFNNDDRPASADMPAYKNVHENFALISGHR
jgi:hypothetical protein